MITQQTAAESRQKPKPTKSTGVCFFHTKLPAYVSKLKNLTLRKERTDHPAWLYGDQKKLGRLDEDSLGPLVYLETQYV